MNTTDSDNQEPDLQKFVDSLNPQRVLTLQIIVAALASGVFMFLAVALFFHMGQEEKPLIAEGKEVMLAITAAMSLGAAILFFILPQAAIAIPATPQSYGNAESTNTPEDKAFAQIQVLNIMRFAILEGAAMIGLVFFFIGWGTLHLAALVPMFALAYLAFPTRKRIIDSFIRYIKKDPRLLNTVRL